MQKKKKKKKENQNYCEPLCGKWADNDANLSEVALMVAGLTLSQSLLYSNFSSTFCI